MPIPFHCQHCGKGYTVADDMAGQQAKCAACGKVMAVPGSPPTAAPAGAASAGDVVDAEPRVSAGRIAAIIMAILAPIAVIAVVGYTVTHRPPDKPPELPPVVEKDPEPDPTLPLALPADVVPRAMTLNQFLAAKSVDKAWVYLTGYEVLPKRVALQTELGQEDRYQRVWIPLTPRDAGPPPGDGAPVRLIVRSNQINDESELSRFRLRQGFVGRVVGKGDPDLTKHARDTGLDAASTWVVELASTSPGWLPPPLEGAGTTRVSTPPTTPTTPTTPRTTTTIEVPPTVVAPTTVADGPQQPTREELADLDDWTTAADSNAPLGDPVTIAGFTVRLPTQLPVKVNAVDGLVEIEAPYGDKGFLRLTLRVLTRPADEYPRHWPAIDTSTGVFSRVKLEKGLIHNLGYIRAARRNRVNTVERWNFRYLAYSGEQTIEVIGYADNSDLAWNLVKAIAGTIQKAPKAGATP